MKTGAALLGAAALLALPSPAEAGRLTSWYGVFEGGANWSEDADISQYLTPAPVPVASSLQLDVGWAALASVGYAYSNGWRVELEGGYREHQFDTVTPALGVPVPALGDLQQYTLMANVLYDFPSVSGLTFTLGGGVGADYARLDATSFAPPVQGNKVSLAFQAIAGFSYPLADWLDMVMNYRYLYVTDLDFQDEVVAAPSVAHVEFDKLQQHLVTLGFRFGSHQKERPAVLLAKATPPPPPPAVARQYVIYFGFNKCSITADADMVLGEAASAARTLGAVAVKIVGHTDTVGSHSANQRLSQCRASAAKSNLVGKGIPAGSISAVGVGETQLMVETRDGIKEPQNRRATVDLN